APCDPLLLATIPGLAVGQCRAGLSFLSIPIPVGYQRFGRTTTPIYDSRQRYPDFNENPVLLKPGDILRWRSVDRDGYDRIWAGIEDGTYRFPIRKVTFEPEGYLRDPPGYTKGLMGGG